MEEIDYDSEELENCKMHLAKSNFGFCDGPALAAEALKDLLDAYLPLSVEWRSNTISWTFDLPDVQISLFSSPISVSAQSDVMPRRQLDPLRHELREILQSTLLDTFWNTWTFGVMLLQLVEAAYTPPPPPESRGWDSASISTMDPLLNNDYGLDLSTIRDTAQHLLGSPISRILDKIPSELRILHVEPVFRSDLVQKFLAKQRQIRNELSKLSNRELQACIGSKRVGDMAEYLSQAQPTFHGAPRNVIASIVRHGFVVPGRPIGASSSLLSVRCGSTYGQGIYSSPSLQYASVYGQNSESAINPGDIPGFRIVVCATLMGRAMHVTLDEARRVESLLDERAHSHVSPNKLEYIVFKSAQILPCYVLHVDFGSFAARQHLEHLRASPSKFLHSTPKRRIATEDDDPSPGALKAKKEALKAAAAKWFPYGYGPAQGTKFVIEEIGDVSDDEEEYGEYQAVRGEQGNEIKVWESEAREGVSWFDEYQTARRG